MRRLFDFTGATFGRVPVQSLGGDGTTTTSFLNSAGDFTSVFQPPVTANPAISQTAGGAYTATEQAMLNDSKALLNQIRSVLIANGMMQ
jgi:hypothetical protein